VRGSHVVRLGDVPIGAGRGTEGAARWALPESLVVTLFAKQQLHSRRGAAAGEGGGGRSYEPKLSELVLTVLPPTSHGPGAGAGGDGGDACTSPAVLRFVAKLDLAAHATVAGAPSQLRLAFDGGDGGALELAITARWLREVVRRTSPRAPHLPRFLPAPLSRRCLRLRLHPSIQSANQPISQLANQPPASQPASQPALAMHQMVE
jgi:hypothetical protein